MLRLSTYEAGGKGQSRFYEVGTFTLALGIFAFTLVLLDLNRDNEPVRAIQEPTPAGSYWPPVLRTPPPTS